MDFVQLTEPKEVKRAVQHLAGVLKIGAKPYRRVLGFQGDNISATVHWQPKLGFWAVVDEKSINNRFWVAFGTQDPSNNSSLRALNITCETNVPKVGVNRRIAGALYRKGSELYLCHNGRVGGGAKGVGRIEFLRWYSHHQKITFPPGIIVANTHGPSVLTDIADFVHAVDQFKVEVRTSKSADEQVESDAESAVEEGEFDTNGYKQNREKVWRSINRRRGQPEFREKLIEAYSGRCAISDCNCKDALEAAHIGGYWGESSNHVRNGVLLRSDLHTLFDMGKIGIMPDSLKIVVAKQLLNTVYAKFHGKKLNAPAKSAQQPHPGILQDHLERWKLCSI